MTNEIQDITLIASNYKNHTISDLTACLLKASTQKEKDFFFDLLDNARHKAALKVIK